LALRPARPLGAELLVDRQLGDALAAGQRGLEPGVEGAHRGAVLDHGLAHVAGLGAALAALQQRARVDGLDHRHPFGHGLAQAERHALGVDEQAAAGRQRGQRLRRAGIGRDADAVGGQRRHQGRRQLAFADKQRARLRIEQQVAQEHRVEVHVAAAQVGDPGQVVDGADQVVAGAMRGHRLAHGGQLVGAGLRGVGRGVFVHRLRRQRRALGPDGVDEVEVGAQHHAGGRERALQRGMVGQAQHLAVDRHRCAARHLARQPVDVQLRGAGGDLLQPDAGAGQLDLGLRPVAAVGKQRRVVDGDHQGAHAAGEAREPLARLPAPRQVFRQMRVGARHQQRVHAVLQQHLAQLRDAQADRGGAGVHGKRLVSTVEAPDSRSAP
jgi:hypothetical protein